MLQSLTTSDLRSALEALRLIGDGLPAAEAFAQRGVACLPRLVSSELTTLSVCNLETGHRSVVSDCPGAISRREIDAFDRHFHEHPLVREHGCNPDAVTRRIGDLLPESRFRSSALYNDYYRAIGIDHVMAVPIHVDRRMLVSFVLNRKRIGFSDRDRERLEVIRPHLGNLYRLGAREVQGEADSAGLTPREGEVLRWVSAGKTDKDIAAILAISPRTVNKHLQNVYEKLGVETRTAAAMRAASWCPAPGPTSARAPAR